MATIAVLDQNTIDKIAAGEVVERPASVVKELVENAMDAGATAITVEIRDGGISLVRITDNGSGIPAEQVPLAFLRHATSKIRSVEELVQIASLGFRGEALSSISAVAQIEMITKTPDALTGTRYVIEGGAEKANEEVGAPTGTTFLVRNLFYNTPARQKFLKTPVTEANAVTSVVEQLALSHPGISFKYMVNSQVKLHTSGNRNLKELVYNIYGRDIARELIEIHSESPLMTIDGFIGKPVISRGNRNFENYYVNGRYVRSKLLARAIEDGYQTSMMQHKYPFVVLHIEIDGEHVDVNVHPTKMELRFNNQQEVYNAIYSAVDQGLHEKELIPHVEMPEPKPAVQSTPESKPAVRSTPEPKTVVRSAPEPKTAVRAAPEHNLEYFMSKMKERVLAEHEEKKKKEETVTKQPVNTIQTIAEEKTPYMQNTAVRPQISTQTTVPEPPKQMELFEDHLLTREAMQKYKVVGQVFETYWLVEYDNSLYIIDQHAAHERVLYEKTLKSMQTREFTSQMISPPIVLNLSMREAELLNTYMDRFTRIGFEIEEFGQDSYAVRAVPDNLFSIAKKELLIQMLDSLSDEIARNQSPDLIDEKIASMSCKAAVKGNMKLSVQEVDALIGELLSLDNPYHCPHGRPTIIAMTKRELEKKFKRIV